MNDEAVRQRLKLQQQMEEMERRLVILVMAASRDSWEFFEGFVDGLSDDELSHLWMLTGDISERLLKARKAREANLQ